MTLMPPQVKYLSLKKTIGIKYYIRNSDVLRVNSRRIILSKTVYENGGNLNDLQKRIFC